MAPPVIPGPAAAPDRETLARVLDGLRELPEQPVGRSAPGSGGTTDAAPAVPLPRRRSERRGTSVD